jgi:UDP-3-O-[3-hydroxymyristoyl] glucosamine N-acyltransferase
MNITLEKLAPIIGAEVAGPFGQVEITGVAGIEHAGPGDLTFAESARLLERARSAGAVIIPPDVPDPPMPFLRAANPRLAFARALALFAPKIHVEPGVHPTAVSGREVEMADDASVGALCFLGDRVRIGRAAVIYPMVYLGDDVTVGEEATIYPNVTVYRNVEIGARTIIHSGAVIGADGFGFTRVDGRHHKIPQIGRVVIGDDVEIGAGVCIDRATTGTTIVGSGTKIDNLVQIGHNCKIGRDCIIVAQAGLAGSATLGDRVVMAGRAAVSDHVTVGEDSVIMAYGAAISDVPPGSQVSGFPARPHDKVMRAQAAAARLPEIIASVRSLQRRVEALEAAIKKGGQGS